jgi:tRNA threonylcarbamoyladenosine biosynthesis protein TsaE
MSRAWPLPDVQATERLGAALARSCPWSDTTARVVYLSGELGAGKTTLAAALLRTLGVSEPVRSPSYALIELYQLGSRSAAHIDLYRLNSALELDTLGLRDYLNPQTLLLIEWPERGGAALPRPDVRLQLDTLPGRSATLGAASPAGSTWISALNTERG